MDARQRENAAGAPLPGFAEHLVEDVADQQPARFTHPLRTLVGLREDSRGTVRAKRASGEVGVVLGPAVHQIGVGLDVKLQSEGVLADAESLVRAELALR